MDEINTSLGTSRTPNSTSTAPIPTEQRNITTPEIPTPNPQNPPTETNQNPPMNPQEEIGFHKGALNTLIAERNELVKIVGNIDAIMRAHMKRLQELGVDVGGTTTQQIQQ